MFAPSEAPLPNFSSPSQPRASLNKKAEVFLESEIFSEAESLSYHSGFLTVFITGLPSISLIVLSLHRGERVIKYTHGHT